MRPPAMTRAHPHAFHWRPAGLSLLLLATGGCATLGTELTTALDMNPLALERALASPVNPQAEREAQLQWQHDERAGMLLAQHPRQHDVETIMRKLAAVSHKPALNPVIGIINDPAINASVDASGYVRVNRGLLDFTTSEDALAGVLGHELSHVDAGHIHRQMTTSLLTGLAAYGATELVQGETADQVMQTVAAAIGPAYSRQHEREADILGTVYAYRAGFNPRALERVFGELARQQAGRQQSYEGNLQRSYQQFAVAANNYQAAAERYQLTPTPGRARAAQRWAQVAQQAQRDYVRSRAGYVNGMSALAPMFSSHPLNEERAATIMAVMDFLEGKRQFTALPVVAQTTIHTLAQLEARQGYIPPHRTALAGATPQPATAPVSTAAHNASAALPMRCPVDGMRFSPYMTTCPQHHVPLEPVTN